MATGYNGIDHDEIRRQREEAERIAREEQERAEAEARQAEENAAAAAEAAQESAQQAQEEANTQMNEQALGAAPLNPAAPETPDPAYAGVRSGGMGRITAQDKLDAQFMREEREAISGTRFNVARYDELEGYDESKNRAHMISMLVGHAADLPTEEETGNVVSIDYNSVRSKEQAYALMMVYSDDEAKVKGGKKLASALGMDFETFLAEAENYMFDKYGRNVFSSPYSPAAKNRAYTAKLNEVGLTDVAGNTLDLQTASIADVIQACKMDPSGATADAVYAVTKEMAKVPGNPWYGMSVDKDMFKFVESSELTKADYNDHVENINQSFAYSSGETDGNMAAYVSLYDDIKAQYGDNPRVMGYLIRELNQSYSDHTGTKAPTKEQAERALAETESARIAAANGAKDDEEARENIFKAISEWVSGGVDWLKNLGNAEDKPREETEYKTVEQIIKEMEAEKSSGGSTSPIMSGGTASINGQMLDVSNPIASTGEMPPMSELFPADGETGEFYGPTPQEGSRLERKAYDPNMTGEQAWIAHMNGYTLDPRNEDLISRWTNPEISGVVYGSNAAGVSAYLEGGNQQTPGAGAYGAKASGVITPDAAVHGYRKYGAELGKVANSLAASSLKGEARASAECALMDIAADLFDMAATPYGASRPTGTNLYDYGLSQRPELLEKLKTVDDLIKQANGSYSENVVNAQEERDARMLGYQQAAANGTATPEMLSAMADYYAQDWVDVEADEWRNELVSSTNGRDSFFAENGLFWQGESMAAIEGRNIRTAGGAQGFADFSQDLQQATRDVIDSYTTAAHNIGMTLKEYLGSAGITGIDQIADIAYNGMQSQGRAIFEDEALRTAINTAHDNPADTSAILGTNKLRLGDQLGLGAEIGALDYAEGFAQASYMLMDMATYDVVRQSNENEYRNKYGDQASAMYRRDLNEMIASGMLSQEMAAELQANMDRAYNIFDVGYEIDPNGLKGFLRQTQAELGKRVELLQAVKGTLEPDQQRLIDMVSSGASSLTGMAVNAATMGAGKMLGAGATVSRVAGAIAGTGLNAFEDAYDENVHAKGMSSATAAKAAFGEAAAMTIIEHCTPDSMTGVLFGDAAIDGAKLAARKNLPAFARATLGWYMRENVQEGLEEGLQTLTGGIFDLMDSEWQAYDRGEGFSVSHLMKTMENGLRETDYAALGKEVLTSFGSGFAMGAVFNLFGVAANGRMAIRDAQAFKKYESVNLATQIAEGTVEATDENLGKLHSMLKEDLNDPAFCRYIDKSGVQATKDRQVMTAMLEGVEADTLYAATDHAAKAREYKNKAAAASTASDMAKSRFLEIGERVENGQSKPSEMDDALAQWQKAQTAYNEAKNAANKEADAASRDTKVWLKACQERGNTLTSESMKVRINQIANMRTGLAQRLEKLYASMEEARANYEGTKSDEKLRERVTDIVTGTTKQERIEQSNITAVDSETFIDERYPDADDETRAAIANAPAWSEVAQENADEPRSIHNAVAFAGRLSKRFGVDITFTDSIEGGAQGKYEAGKITIEKKTATQGEVIRKVMVHELTHKAEESEWYGDLRDALIDIGYGGDSDRLNADVQAKMKTYNDHAAAIGSGKTYTEAEIEQEIVADLAGDLFTADEATVERLVQEKPNLMQRIYETIRDFVRKLRGVSDPELDKIRNAEKLMRKALDTASGVSSKTQFSIQTTGDGTQYVLVDTDQDIFEGHEPNEYPAIAKEYIKNRFRHTVIGEGENRAYVDAKTGNEYTHPAKRVDQEAFSGKMRAATELDNLLKASKFIKNSGPEKRHPEFPGGFDLHDVVFEVSGKPFQGRLNIGIDEAGRRRLYDMTKIKSLDPEIWVKQRGSAAAQVGHQGSTDSIAENTPADNRKYSLPSPEILNQEIAAYRARGNRPAVQTGIARQEGTSTRETAPVQGERQFATVTAQASEAMPRWLKDELMNDPKQRYYDRDTNNAQLMRAWNRYQQEGYEGVRDRILKAEHFTADDIADANMIMAMAFRNEDVGTALEVAKKYNMEGTKEGQTLQARQIFKRMSPTGIRTWAAGEAETKLAEHISTHSRQKRDVDAAAKRVADKIRNMQSGDEVLRLNAAGDFTISASNNKWGIPINEQQKALIDQYNLGSVARPGLFYNRATRKQRMLEAILATPNPLEVTGNGLNLIQRLEYMQDGEAVITNADLNYIGHQLAQYAAMDADVQQEREGDLALSRAYEAYGNITPATLEEKARTWRYTSMLFSIASAGRNIIGNAAQNVANATSHGIAVELDKRASLVTGKRTMAHLSAADRAKGWNAFADETVNTFKDFYTDKTVTATMRGDDRFSADKRGRVYENNLLETMRLTEGYLMSVGDRNFWKKAYVNSIAEQQRVAAKNGVDLDMNEAAEIARAEANYATFNEDNAVRNQFLQLKKNKSPIVRSVVDFIMPFTGVPTNITKRMVEYSPVGLFFTMISRAYDAARGKNFDQKAFITELSRGLTGTALFGIGMLMKEAGLIMLGTGDEDDTKVYGVRTAQGGQYSLYIRVGDEYVSLAAFAPAVSPLIMGATAVDLFKEDEDKLNAIYNACLAGLDQIFDASYMSSFQDIFTGYGSTAENLGTTVLNSMVSQNVPALLGQMATAMDPYVRDTKDKSAIMQALKSGLIAKIPGLREMLPEKVDVAGKSVISKEGLRNFFDPFTTTKAADDPALDELMRLYEATGESSFMPVDALSGTKNTLTVNKEKITVDGKDKETYKKRYGELWHEEVSKLISRASYQRMSDEKKMEKISEIVKDAKTKAAKEIAMEIKRRNQ